MRDSKIIDNTTEFEGKPVFNPGGSIQGFFSPILERNNPYFNTIVLTIEEKGYGVIEDEEDFEYIDRLNVISIKGGEGSF